MSPAIGGGWIWRALASKVERVGKEAGTIDALADRVGGIAPERAPFDWDGRRSVLAKSNSCGVGEEPVPPVGAAGRRFGIGVEPEYDGVWFDNVGRLDHS